MAQLSRHRARHLIAWLAVLPLVPAVAQAELDLVGTWHVLVHYTDDHSNSPDQQRWLDRVWVFSRKGKKLYWAEYPIVVFSDEKGRFERSAVGYSRVLGAWEPSEAQRRNIQAGLEINSRGAKKKSLRGSDEEGWHTTARARPGSASIITYQENWSVESLQALPLFVQEDVMASARSESLEGVTRYETTAVETGGSVLIGRYDRDGSRRGTFRMTRSGAARPLTERSQREVQADALRRSGVESDPGEGGEQPVVPPDAR
jgi:hypothetical protein